ncbi:TonB-dependent receptor [Bacteroides sp.]
MGNEVKWLMVAFLLLPALLHAQRNKVDTLHTYWIDEVTVTSSRKLSKEIIPVQIMEGAQLEKLTVHSVADAIRYFSGVQIKDFGGIGGLKTVNIRSMGTNHVGVFYDGIELGNAQNGQIDLGRFSLDNMEAVSIYNGQRSAIFQSAKDFGSAGSVYLQSRTPKFEDTERYHIRGSFKTGSFGVVNPSILWEQKINDRISYSFSTDYMHTTGRYKYRYKTTGGYDTTAVRKNGDVGSIRMETGLYGNITDGEWKSKVYFYHSERGLPGAMVRNKLFHEDRQWDTNAFAQASVKKHFSNKYSLLVNGKYAYDYLHYLADPNKDATLMYIENHYRQQEAYFSTANLYNFNKHWSASVAVDYQWNKLNADLYNFPYPTRHTILVSAASALSFEPFKLQASVLGTFVMDHVRTDTLSMENKKQITPTVVASYKPFRKVNFHLRGFYKNIFRMPTLNDLYYTFIGNIKLKPEFTNQYNIGFTYAPNIRNKWLKTLELQTDAYYNEVKNKIVAVPTSNQFRWTMMNLGMVEIRGVDVALQSNWKLPKEVSIDTRLTYTYQKAQDFTDASDTYYGDQIPYIPWHSGSLIINAAWKDWDVNYSFIYTGERYDQRANIPENYAPEWYTSDISLSRTLRTKGIRYRLTAEVNNLFNQQFEVVKCYPMPGVNYKFILTIHI